MAEPSQHDKAARYRAAAAHKGLDDPDVAEALHMSKRTWQRVKAGDRQLSDDELRDLQQATEVPWEFFDRGFSNAPETDLLIELRAHRQMLEEATNSRQQDARRLLELMHQNHEILKSVHRMVRQTALDEAGRLRERMEQTRQAEPPAPADREEDRPHQAGGQ